MSTKINLFLFDESLSSNVSMSEIEKTSILNGYVLFSFDATLLNNRSYQLKISDFDTNKILFRGKAFCTNQSTQNYSING